MLYRKMVLTRYGIAGVFLTLSLFLPTSAHAQEPFYGEVRLFAATYCPKGWLEADGRLLPISQHQVLYSLLMTSFGGDGQVSFQLPDLRGRTPVGRGRGIGLSANNRLGEMGGRESISLTTQEMLVHSHTLNANQGPGDNTASVSLGSKGSTALVSQPVQNTGASSPHENRPPYQVLRYCVAIDGLYPSRP